MQNLKKVQSDPNNKQIKIRVRFLFKKLDKVNVWQILDLI